MSNHRHTGRSVNQNLNANVKRLAVSAGRSDLRTEGLRPPPAASPGVYRWHSLVGVAGQTAVSSIAERRSKPERSAYVSAGCDALEVTPGIRQS